jgi:hypothetical protein
MTPENFCYWLQGVFEIQKAGLDATEKRSVALSQAQVDMIDAHLQSVFKAKTTSLYTGHSLVDHTDYSKLITPTTPPTAIIC